MGLRVGNSVASIATVWLWSLKDSGRVDMPLIMRVRDDGRSLRGANEARRFKCSIVSLSST